VDELADRSVLAIDLGGTQVRAALITSNLAVHERRAVPTRDEDGVDAVVGRICEVAAGVLADARAAGLPAPIAVGISAPGPLDPWRGVVIATPNLAGWHDVPLGSRVAEALGLPTFVERDTNVAVLAEWRYGAARGARTVIYVTVSTGIGGGLIIDERPLLGPDGTAGEVGHIVADLDGPRCGCGRIGHVEAMASGTALARDARILIDRGGSPRLAALAATGADVDAALVARAADEGDSASADLLRRAWVVIGAMCASLVNVLNPDVIVIGGSIAEHRPELLDVVRDEIGRRAFAVPAARVRVEPAELKDDVSLIGCLPIVAERLTDPAFGGGSHPRPPAATIEQGALRP
jgi:glucokinase